MLSIYVLYILLVVARCSCFLLLIKAVSGYDVIHTDMRFIANKLEMSNSTDWFWLQFRFYLWFMFVLSFNFGFFKWDLCFPSAALVHIQGDLGTTCARADRLALGVTLNCDEPQLQFRQPLSVMFHSNQRWHSTSPSALTITLCACFQRGHDLLFEICVGLSYPG